VVSEKPSAVLGFSDFARHVGMKPSYITQLKKEGRLVLTDDGKAVRVAESVQRINETRDPSKQGVADRHAVGRATQPVDSSPPPQSKEAAADPQGDNGRIGNTYQAARAVKERYLAMSAKREYEIAIGRLMDADDVKSFVADAIVTLRTRLESLPDVLAPQLVAISDEAIARTMIAESIEHALEECATAFRQASKETANE
jgi:hypothetical protein